MNQETINSYGKIISKTVYDYIAAHGIRTTIADDLVQECWMGIIEYQSSEGKLPSFPLAKTICHRRIVDYIRHEMRRNHASLDDPDSEGDRSSWHQDTSYNLEDEAELNYLISMFPKGSRERAYLEFYLEKAQARETSGKMTPPITRQDDGYVDNNLAKMLGFKGTGDRGWKTFRNRMRGIIRDFYGRK